MHSYCKFLYAEYENNLYLIIRLHFYPFYFGLGRAGLVRTQPEPVTGWPEKARADHGLARNGPARDWLGLSPGRGLMARAGSSKKARTKPGWPGPRANTSINSHIRYARTLLALALNPYRLLKMV